MFPNVSELKRLRVKSGYSQQDLAKQVDVSQSAIAKYENGIQIPSYTIATKIFQLLLESEVINEPTLREVMITDILFLRTDDTLQDAKHMMKQYSISQIPIKNQKGEITGTINESKLLDLIDQYHSLEQFNQEEIENIMDQAMPIVPQDAKITEISSLLKRYGGVLVSHHGRIVGIVTKSDVLQL